MIKLIHGDCIEKMQQLIKKGIKVDLILTDPSYGVTNCKWDSIIPLKKMWARINELSKERTPALLFGREPFNSTLRLSNQKNYRYDIIWNKEIGTNFLNANRMPMQCHEIVSVFYKKLPVYHPQKKYVGKKYNYAFSGLTESNIYAKSGIKEKKLWSDDGYRYPTSIVTFGSHLKDTTHSKRLHPTQKPLPLLEYLIKTYSNENDVVLDFTMGSGSTGVACKNTKRKFIGIELDDDYYNIAKERIK